MGRREIPDHVLRMAETILKALDSAGLGMTVTVDSDGELQRVYASETLAEILGYSAEEVGNVPPMVQFAESERERMNGMLEAWRAGESLPAFYRTRIVSSKGEEIPVDVGLATTTWHDKPATVAFVRDVREQVAIEEELRASEQRFRALVDLAPDVVVVAVAGAVRYGNRAALTTFGLGSLEDFIGRPLTDFVQPRDVELAKERLGKVEKGDTLSPHEYSAIRSDGTVFPFEVSSMPILWEGVPAILEFGRDVSERRRHEAELIEADRMASVGLLAAGVAHEINNPLTYTLLHLAKLKRMLPDLVAAGEQQQEVLRLVDEAIEGGSRVGNIVRDLLSFVRGHDGGVQPVDLASVVRSAVKLAQTAVDSSAKIDCQFDSAPMVLANEAKLGQVFVNLVVNSLQAMQHLRPDDRRLDIHLVAKGGAVHVKISDRGSGIDPAVAGRIFDAFFTTKDNEGTGLGLAISKSIIAGLGGTIGASPREGGGTTFAVCVPMTEMSKREEKARSTSVSGPARVLIVDDDDQVATAIGELLSERYDVVCRNDCKAALALMVDEGENFDAVLCALSMPEVDGVNAYESLCSFRPDMSDRVLFVSGGARDARQQRFANVHEDRLLTKPIDVEAIFNRIDALIEKTKGR